MKFYRYPPLLLPLLSTVTPIVAEEISPIIVTATRTAQSTNETLASVTTIERDEIEQSQANSVLELIQNRTVGVDLSRNGGLGTNTSLFIRGTNSNHVLVLIDGVRVNSAIDGGFKWANLPLEQVERIEIVRGPRSALYGSDAIGGVVQIFTRKGKDFHAMIGGGSYNTSRSELGTGGSLGAGHYHLNAGFLKSGGFSAAQPGTYGYEPDDDGYHNVNFGAGISYPLNDRTEMALNLLHSDGEVDTDSGSSTQLNNSASLKFDWAASEQWQQSFSLGNAQDHYETDDGYETLSIRNSFGWQNDIQLNDEQLLTLGIEFIGENGENVGSYNHDSDSKALYAQHQWQGKQLDIQLGARGEEHSAYGQHSTGQFAVGTQLGLGRLYASYGSAFKAPTFLQLYYPYGGNIALQPEESVTTELGYRVGALQATLFDTHIENLIEWASGFNNVSRAHTWGAELEYGHKVGSWQLNSGLTLQRAENEDTGAQLSRRAKKKLFFTASGPLNTNSNLGIEVSYTGPRMDGSVELSSYTLLNLSGEYRFTKQWSLSGRIDNFLNEEYQLANGYNTPGLSAYANINFRM